MEINAANTTAAQTGAAQQTQQTVPAEQTPQAPPAQAGEQIILSLTGENAKALGELLETYGLKNTPENVKMLETLLQSGFPLNKDTVAKFNQALKLLGADNVEKALFFMNNDLRVGPKNAEMLERFAQGEIKIAEQLGEITKTLDGIKQPALRDAMAETLLKGADALPEAAKLETVLREIKDIVGFEKMGGKADVTADAKISEAIRGSWSSEGLAQLVDAIKTASPEKAPVADRALADVQRLAEGLADPAKAGSLREGIRQALDAGNLTRESLTDLVKAVLPERGEPPTKQEMAKMIQTLFPDAENGVQKPENAVLRDRLFDALRMPEEKSGSVMERLAQKLKFPVENSGPRDVDRFLNELRDNVETARREAPRLLSAEPELAAKLGRELENVRGHIDFASHMKENVFVQLPLVIGGRETNSELYVFKDGKRGRGGKKAAAALIALDTASLGRFELYLQRNDRAVNCQFRLENDGIESLVRQHMPKLVQLFEEVHFRLEGAAFLKTEEAFTPLSPEPELGEAHEISGVSVDMKA